MFVSKLDSAGNFVWARRMGGTGYDCGQGIAVAADGSVYTTGEFNVTADFDPGPSTYNLTSAGGDDMFVSRLDQTGISAQGGISVTASGDLTISAPVLDSGGGDISLASGSTASDDLTLYARVAASGGDGSVNLQTGHDLVVNDSGPNGISVAGAGTIAATAQGSIQLNAGADVASAGGSITLNADTMAIDTSATPASINAAAGVVTLRNVSASRPINLGTATGEFDLTDEELDRVTAGTLRIGRNDGTSAGAIDISSAVSPANTTDLHLLSGSTVDGAGAITMVTGLAINAGGAVTLTNANEVDNLAIKTTTGNIALTDSDGLAVASVDSVNGIDTDSGSVALVATMGSLTVQNADGGGAGAVNDLESTGTITVTLEADNALFTISTNATVSSGDGTHTYTADKMSLGGTITATGQRVILKSTTAGDTIDLGSMSDSGGDTVLELSSAELGSITAATLEIGTTSSGAVTISQDVTLGVITSLHLKTGSSVTGTAGGILGEKNLAITAGGPVTVNDPQTAMATVAVSAAGQDVTFTESNGLSIGDVDGVQGVAGRDIAITATAGQLTVTNGGAANDIAASGTVSLAALGDDALLTIVSSAAISGTAGDHTYTADEMNLSGTIDATGYTVVLLPRTTASDAIKLGTATAATDDDANTLELADAELDAITAAILRVGSSTAGAITVSGPISLAPANAGTLSLETGRAILDGNASGDDITASNLLADAGTGIASSGDPLETAVSRIHADGGTGGVFVDNTGELSVDDLSPDFGFALRAGAGNGDFGYSVATDSWGNVYVAGWFEGTVDFDPGAGVYNLTSAGDRDLFVAKYSSTGDLVWARNIGGTGDDRAKSIAVADDGSVYTTGFFKGTVDFDPGAGTFNLTTAGVRDIFVSKLDSQGNFVWARSMGASGEDEGIGICVADDGSVYTSGFFRGTTDFDPGAGTFNLTSAGGSDAFVSKLDSQGNFLWAGRMGGTSEEFAEDIVVGADGSVYTTGYFKGTADFDPGAGSVNLTSAGGDDLFVSKLDSSGNLLWAGRMGGTAGEHSEGIAVRRTEVSTPRAFSMVRPTLTPAPARSISRAPAAGTSSSPSSTPRATSPGLGEWGEATITPSPATVLPWRRTGASIPRVGSMARQTSTRAPARSISPAPRARTFSSPSWTRRATSSGPAARATRGLMTLPWRPTEAYTRRVTSMARPTSTRARVRPISPAPAGRTCFSLDSNRPESAHRAASVFRQAAR